MVVCKHLCVHTNHNKLDFLLIQRFLGHNISDFQILRESTFNGALDILNLTLYMYIFIQKP